MTNGTQRRERVHELIDMALAYRRVTKTRLAAELERDRSRLYANSGNPKLDLLVGLAKTLEWSIDLIVGYILRDRKRGPVVPAGDYAALDEAAKAAGCAGDYARVAELGRQMFIAARTPDERARACRREGAGWGEQMRATEALAAFERGLELTGVSNTERLALEVSLANTYYNLWRLAQAIGLAHVVLDAFAGDPPVTTVDRITAAFAHYVRGNSLRRTLDQRPPDARAVAARAKHDLERAETLYMELAREPNMQYMAGVAHTCHGALLEVAVELGERPPQQALDEVLAELSKLDGNAPWPEGDWLESYGWWCDFGANIAFRHVAGSDLQRAVAVLSGKLRDIAQQLDNWSLRERVASIQYTLHGQISRATGVSVPHTLDAEDLRLITGTIARFPQFRPVGWDLLENSAIVQNAKRM